MGRPPFTCPDCKRTSRNPNDKKYHYCPACKTFHGDETSNAEGALIRQVNLLGYDAVFKEYGFVRYFKHWLKYPVEDGTKPVIMATESVIKHILSNY